jgi:hypothetical protein
MSLRPPRDVLGMAEYAVACIRAKLYSWNYVTQPPMGRRVIVWYETLPAKGLRPTVRPSRPKREL